MKQFPLKSTLTAALMLALTFTLSCSGGDDDGGGSGGSSSGGTSSPSEISSSSSKPSGVSSSSVTAPSSNSTPSSSSVAVSSSSSKPSSSSGGSSSSAGSNGGGGEVVYGPDVPYEGVTYKTVKIGTQTWMAENLNYDVSGSVCYDNDPAQCAKYGRLYDWVTAMALDANCYSTSCASQVSAKHQGICPSGWHIPSNEDWDKLMRYVDGTNGTSSPYDSPAVGWYLKATDGWNDCGPSGSGKSYLCEDTKGFSALPGGIGFSEGDFDVVGSLGFWWSASENNSDNAYSRRMNYDYAGACWSDSSKGYLFSVRCLQD